MLKCVLFDCDGVLLDTLEANRYFYDAILERLGYPVLTAPDLKIVHAMTVKEAFAHILTPADALKAPGVAETLDRESYRARVRVPAYLHELLARLKPAYKLGIVTNRDAKGASMLEAYDLLTVFDAVVTASDVTAPKPAPEGIYKICGLLGVLPVETLFVGDSQADMAAAVAAGANFAAYGNPSLKTALHAENMHALEQIIGSLETVSPV